MFLAQCHAFYGCVVNIHAQSRLGERRGAASALESQVFDRQPFLDEVPVVTPFDPTNPTDLCDFRANGKGSRLRRMNS